jgi:hypothetical protein
MVSPGTAILLWDNLNVGTTTISPAGSFSAAITVPTSTAGQHTLTIQDAATSVCVNVAYMPTLTTDYISTEMWHLSDFAINITADSPVNETFYRIDGGDVQNVTASGQPILNLEGANNTLEYWCTWSPNGTALVETSHVLVAGIKLDKTGPTASISTSTYTESKTINLYLSAADAVSGVTSMRFSNDNSSWSGWETYANNKTWTLDGADGAKTVYAQFQNGAGLVSAYNVTVTLMTPTPAPTTTQQPTPTPTSAATQTPTVAPTETPASTENPSATAVPELTWEAAFVVFVCASLFLLLIAKKRSKQPS